MYQFDVIDRVGCGFRQSSAKPSPARLSQCVGREKYATLCRTEREREIEFHVTKVDKRGYFVSVRFYTILVVLVLHFYKPCIVAICFESHIPTYTG